VEIGPALDLDEFSELLSVLGLSKLDVYSDCPVHVISTGHSKVILGIQSRMVLNSHTPNLAGLVALSHRINCNG